MPVKYTIRPAATQDLDRLLVLFLELQDHVERSTPDLWHMSAEARDQLRPQLANRLTAPGSCVLVAARQAPPDILGMVFGRIVTSTRYLPGRTGAVEQLYVDPSYRRRRIATALVAQLCRFFAAGGVDDLSLRYAVGNAEAVAFWASLGFAPRIVTAGTSRALLEARLALSAHESTAAIPTDPAGRNTNA